MILFPQKYYTVSKKNQADFIFFSHKTTSASGLDPFSKSTSVTTFFKKKYNLPEIGSVKQVYHQKTASCCNLCTIHRSHDLFSTRSLVNVFFFQDQQTNLQDLTAVPSLTGFELWFCPFGQGSGAFQELKLGRRHHSFYHRLKCFSSSENDKG